MNNNSNISNELQAIYNFMESEFLALHKKAKDKKELDRYLKGRNIENKLFEALRDKSTFIDFLKSIKSSKVNIIYVIEVFFAHKYGQDLDKKRVIIEALKATDNIKFIEVANKLKEFSDSVAAISSTNLEYSRARLLLTLIYNNKINIDFLFNSSNISINPSIKLEGSDGKKRSVKSELEYMKRQTKKISRDNINLSKKYKNIALLNNKSKIDSLYSLIGNFFTKHKKELPYYASDVSLSEIRQFIISNKEDFITYCFAFSPLLRIIKDQPEGRIR